MPQPKEIFLSDYQPSNYSIQTVHLTFDLFDTHTTVKNSSTFTLEKQNKKSLNSTKELFLNGIDLKLLDIKINGNTLEPNEYELNEKGLTIKNPPEQFTLQTTVEIDPESNKQLMGLYMSDGMYCTQNEPEGFRRITYHIDRPDVMSVFTTTIRADKIKYPILLSNGNPSHEKQLENNRHEITWHDPFPKPTYLFALVAGDLVITEDEFVTMSRRTIPLRIYTEAKHKDRTEHAMESLIKSMKWDEERFGREYDLDIFMIVAVDAFNSGAMENKGLNIFNASCVLCDPQTASDGDYKFIERVVAHEYFHNWTGNRITCRDWFQLTLKEGLTVYRDTEFSMDMGDPTIKRIEDVSMLKEHQFAEDSGPMAHPIKPPSFIQIENFYTSTVYEKGSEVIRMLQTMHSKKGFRKAMDLYFKTFDGQAVTTEDFIWSFEKALGVNLSQFKESWYQQAGTPVLKVEDEYNEQTKEYKLRLVQDGEIKTPYNIHPSSQNSAGSESEATAEEEYLGSRKADTSLSQPNRSRIKSGMTSEWTPFIYPLEYGLIDINGKELQSGSMHIDKIEEIYTFQNIPSKPIPSLLRNFSAPIKLEYEYTLEKNILLFAHDTDNFNRYEAGQRIAKHCITSPSLKGIDGKLSTDQNNIINAYKSILTDRTLDNGFKAECLTLPGLYTLVCEDEIYDYETAYTAKKKFLKILANGLEKELLETYENMKEETFSKSGVSMGKRALKNICLSYLTEIDDEKYIDIAYKQFKSAHNMTDSIRALAILNKFKSEITKKANDEFYEQWKDDQLVINKYFAVLASSPRKDVLEIVKELENNPSFDKTNPNKLRSLYGVFGRNYPFFHTQDGKGYEFITQKIIEIDSFNSKMAGGLCQVFRQYKHMPKIQKSIIKSQLETIQNTKAISDILFEVSGKILES